MSDNMSSRHQLPFLVVSQAQKEITHNEALARIDALLHPAIEQTLAAPPTGLSLLDSGKCWIIGDVPTGIWTDKTDMVALWTGGSWRYMNPVEGMHVWDKSSSIFRFFADASWNSPPMIVNPVGGAVIDVESRNILVLLLDHLRSTGQLAS